MAFFTYKTLKTGLNSATRRHIFLMIVCMFLLSTASWASNVAFFYEKILIRFVHFLPPAERPIIFPYNTLISAIILINYVLTDGVVVWRAWILCGQDLTYRRLLWIPISFLIFTVFSVLTTIVIRIVICARPAPDIYAPSSLTTVPVLERVIRYSQTVTLVFSFLTNILATLIVGLEAWKHRQFIRKEIRLARTKNLRGEKILVLLVESGLLYCISGAAVLICSLVRMPLGTLGDVYTPVNVQIAGIYPVIVLLLAEYQNSQEGTLLETQPQLVEVTGVRQSRSRSETLQAGSRREGTTVDSEVHTRGSSEEV
ncbi:hypothetical protein BDZ89DRAFT_1055985 [Hymenopellis radicata]|nr:hypothetical protein BDZ89DRAFT_1055985 [Hymenopellis radicata]